MQLTPFEHAIRLAQGQRFAGGLTDADAADQALGQLAARDAEAYALLVVEYRTRAQLVRAMINAIDLETGF